MATDVPQRPRGLSSVLKELRRQGVKVDDDVRQLATAEVVQQPRGTQSSPEWSRSRVTSVIRRRDKLYRDRYRAIEQLGRAQYTDRHLLSSTIAAKLAGVTTSDLRELIEPVDERINMHHKSGPLWVLYDPREVWKLVCRRTLDEPAVPDDESSLKERRGASETEISVTEMRQLSLARRGQGLFRKRVMAIERGCRLTGVEDRLHLWASHIKPWADCDSDVERLDGNNGSLLAPHVDHLFDLGLISFQDDGRLLVHESLDSSIVKAWALDRVDPGASCELSERQRVYMAYHRDYRFGCSNQDRRRVRALRRGKGPSSAPPM